MRFLDRIEVLDRIEGDKLAVVVVELHVDPRRQCDALGNSDQVFVVFCCIFEGTPIRRSLCLHDILDLTEGDKLAVVVVELHVGPSDSVMRSTNACNV